MLQQGRPTGALVRLCYFIYCHAWWAYWCIGTPVLLYVPVMLQKGRRTGALICLFYFIYCHAWWAYWCIGKPLLVMSVTVLKCVIGNVSDIQHCSLEYVCIIVLF